ncbi:DUF885 domain-containing protein [Actinomadura sp. NPDC047616]|uniref:DUF885 domain-containing protein n=1 Tax=Actinomadura sp. NPDC047616 TaxID=3155914 RepID=UPI0033CB0AE2
MTALEQLADRYVTEFAALDPCRAAMMGISGQESHLTDYGPDGWAARRELTRRTLAALDGTPLDGPAERVGAAVLRERLEVERALDEAGVPDAFLDTTDGPVQRLRMAFELLDRGPGTPWEAVLARLRALPAMLDGLRTSLTLARRDGRVAARRQVARSAADCRVMTGYLTGLAARHGEFSKDAALGGALRDAAAAAAGALTGFAVFLEEELAPHAPERDALGRDRYLLGVRDFLGTRLDLEDTYAWGWAELARLKAEIAEVAARIRPGATVAEVRAALDADPAHRVRGAEAFRAFLQELADAAIDALDGVHFDIPAPLRRIECRIPAGDAGIYYLSPAEDGSRPGTVWWSVTEPDEDIATWSVPSTMYHEGVPGHHLQLGTATLAIGRLTRFQRLGCELYPGHGEGWALYAERLMDELGFYRDPAHKLGMLVGGQLFRAARVVLDIGLHLELPIPAGTGFHEGERWTPRLAREFLRAHATLTAAGVAFEIDRYLGRPGQAIAYKVGEKVWLEAREAVRRRDGEAFDLKAFHRRGLEVGPMGLDLLRAELTRP